MLRAVTKALPLQARHCDRARAVSSHQDLSLRSAPPAWADYPEVDDAADAHEPWETMRKKGWRRWLPPVSKVKELHFPLQVGGTAHCLRSSRTAAPFLIRNSGHDLCYWVQSIAVLVQTIFSYSCIIKLFSALIAVNLIFFVWALLGRSCNAAAWVFSCLLWMSTLFFCSSPFEEYPAQDMEWRLQIPSRNRVQYDWNT